MRKAGRGRPTCGFFRTQRSPVQIRAARFEIAYSKMGLLRPLQSRPPAMRLRARLIAAPMVTDVCMPLPPLMGRQVDSLSNLERDHAARLMRDLGMSVRWLMHRCGCRKARIPLAPLSVKGPGRGKVAGREEY